MITAPYVKNSFWIIAKDNRIALYTPDGIEVSNTIWIRVQTHVNELNKAVVQMVVNTAESYEEMIKKIEDEA